MGIFSETAEEMRDELVDKYEAEIAQMFVDWLNEVMGPVHLGSGPIPSQ